MRAQRPGGALLARRHVDLNQLDTHVRAWTAKLDGCASQVPVSLSARSRAGKAGDAVCGERVSFLSASWPQGAASELPPRRAYRRTLTGLTWMTG